MCEPITMAAISAVGTAAQISAANQAAEAGQQAAIDRQMAMNAQRQQQAEEEKKKARLEMTQRERKALREKSAAVVTAAETGTAGGNLLRQLSNVYVQKAIDTGTISSINESDLVQIATGSQADYLQTKSTINELEAKKTTGLAAALQIGTSAAQGYGMGGGFSDGMTWGKSVESFKGTWGFG